MSRSWLTEKQAESLIDRLVDAEPALEVAAGLYSGSVREATRTLCRELRRYLNGEVPRPRRERRPVLVREGKAS